MIYCPKCGTANRRGSRFCNECGEPLPMGTALRCPMCGAMNPVGNVYCDQCNARLIPMTVPHSEEPELEQTSIKGLSLPTIPLAEEREQQVEDVTERVEVEEGTEEIEEDWLAQLRASGEEEEEEEKPDAIAELTEPVELPDWLRDMGPISVEAKATPGEEQPATETPLLEEETPAMPTPTPSEIPGWLQGIAPPEAAVPESAPPLIEAAPEEPAPEMPAPAPAEIPDWLQEIAPPAAEVSEAAPPLIEAAPEEPAPEMPAPAPAEIPDWLQEIALPAAEVSEAAPPLIEAAPEEPAPEMPTPAPAKIPDWLREIAPPEAAALETAPPLIEAAPEEPAPEMPAPAPAEIPDWLQEIAPPAAEVSEAAPLVSPPFVGTPPSTVTEVPEWLRESTPAEETAAAPIFEGVTLPFPPESGIGVAEAEGLAQAEIPDWLEALRPRPEAAETTVEEEPVETEGPLQGLRGVLPVAPVIEVTRVRESTLPAEVSEASLARAQLLQSLLAQPAEMPQPEVRRQGISTGERIQRWLVAVVLLVAIGSILILPLVGFNAPTLTQPTTSPAADGRIEFQHLMNLHSAVQSTSAGDTILVAFEYGPPEADELNLVAEPILRHLLDQGAHISVVSTQPEGLAVAAGLLSDIVASEERYTEEQYTLVGYRSGDSTGVSQMLTNFDIPPGGKSEEDTRHRLILVLTAQPAPLRWWIEQTRALGDTHPVVAGVSAALEPAVSPYLGANTGQLKGAIKGLSGAAAYEAHRGLEGQATQRINALAAGHAAVVGLMVLGAIIYAFGGSRGRKK